MHAALRTTVWVALGVGVVVAAIVIVSLRASPSGPSIAGAGASTGGVVTPERLVLAEATKVVADPAAMAELSRVVAASAVSAAVADPAGLGDALGGALRAHAAEDPEAFFALLVGDGTDVPDAFLGEAGRRPWLDSTRLVREARLDLRDVRVRYRVRNGVDVPITMRVVATRAREEGRSWLAGLGPQRNAVEVLVSGEFMSQEGTPFPGVVGWEFVYVPALRRWALHRVHVYDFPGSVLVAPPPV